MLGSPSKGPRSAVRVAGLEKHYGATRALRGVDVTVKPGTVHAFVGENGAGKSTCLGVIAGRTSASSGSVEVLGVKGGHGDTRGMRRAGAVAIYQELTVVPNLTAEANVFLGQPLSRRGFLSEGRMRSHYVELCDRLEVASHFGIRAAELSIADRQVLEIMRALQTEARLIMLDEPTAALAVAEREALLRIMRDLRRNGVTMIFVSHNLDEVLEISDVVTVFRDGMVTDERPVAAWTREDLVHAIVGRQSGAVVEAMERKAVPEEARHRPASSPAGKPAPGLQVEDLSVSGVLGPISFQVAPGEVLGIGGLMGSGRSSVLRALAGAQGGTSGTLWIDGQRARLPRSPRQAKRLGIGLIPEDRKAQGLVPSLPAADNVVLSDLSTVSSHGFIRERALRERAAELAGDYGIHEAQLKANASALSGGNQQKLLLARFGHWRPRILLADEPTRGIDIGAKAKIMETLRSLAADGMAVVFVSSELEEVVALSHRTIVLKEGRLVATLESTTVPLILAHAFGAQA